MIETIPLPSGTLQVRTVGKGPAIVFLHGALVNGSLWDATVERLAPRFRCVVPELPLGSHRIPLPANADRSPLGQARRVSELLQALDLDDVTLVGNDSGGAITQLVAAGWPERIGRLVLTNCDAFEVFPPRAFAWLKTISGYPRAMAAMAQVLARMPALGRLPTAYGRLSRSRIPTETLRAWTSPALDPAIRADLAGFFAGAGPDVLMDAVPALRRFECAVDLAWGTEDPFFPLSLAERLAETFPRASVTRLAGSATYVPLDAPDALADVVAASSAAVRQLRVG